MPIQTVSSRALRGGSSPAVSRFRQFLPFLPWVASVVLAVGIGVMAGCSSRGAAELYQEAVKSAVSCRWQDALSYAQRTVEADRNHLSGRLLKGVALYHNRRSDQAVEALRSAANDAPDDFAAQYFHGWILCETGRYGEALAPLRRALELRPNHRDTVVLLARCAVEQNLPEGIAWLESLRAAPALRDAPEIDTCIAVLYIGQGKYPLAANHLLAALVRDRANPVTSQNLGVLYDRYLGKPALAGRYYRYALIQSQQIGDSTREKQIKDRLVRLAGGRS